MTKGRIPERHHNLLAAHAPLVQGRIGMITLDTAVAAAFEPFAAPPDVRLSQAAELIRTGVLIEARLDPILPEVTDDQESLGRLCAALAGITSINVTTTRRLRVTSETWDDYWESCNLLTDEIAQLKAAWTALISGRFDNKLRSDFVRMYFLLLRACLDSRV